MAGSVRMTDQEFVGKYAAMAMQAQNEYGVPASITLAQAMIESNNGASQLSRDANNFFGMKKGGSWTGETVTMNDRDEKNAKFRKYDSVEASFNDHGRLLQGKTYAKCQEKEVTDYRGWAQSLQSCGYATNPEYANLLIAKIEKLGLSKYDRKAPEMTHVLTSNKGAGARESAATTNNVSTEKSYSMPIESTSKNSIDGALVMTSGYGARSGTGGTTDHKGIDIRGNNDKIYATEDNGKVIFVGGSKKEPAGKYITVEYERENGVKVQCSYLHLSKISVKEGDIVNAGDVLGKSGNTGKKLSGGDYAPHLHFGVKEVSANGEKTYVDPLDYLAEISAKGDLSQTIIDKESKNDLLADKVEEIKTAEAAAQQSLANNETTETLGEEEGEEEGFNLEETIKKMFLGEGGANTGDFIIDMLCNIVVPLLTIVSELENMTPEQQAEVMRGLSQNGTLDISSLVPSMDKCEIKVDSNGDAHVVSEKNGAVVDKLLSDDQTTKLASAINDSSTTTEQKQQAVSSLVTSMTAVDLAAQSYNSISESENVGQSTSMRI